MKQQHSPSKKFTQILKFTVDLSWAWSNCIAWQESLSKIMFFKLTAVPHTPRVQTIQLAGIQKNIFFFYLQACLIFPQSSLWNACGNQIRAGESAISQSCERKNWPLMSLWLFCIQKQPVPPWINPASALFTAADRKVNSIFWS